jgi:hypothetical protein
MNGEQATPSMHSLQELVTSWGGEFGDLGGVVSEDTLRIIREASVDDDELDIALDDAAADVLARFHPGFFDNIRAARNRHNPEEARVAVRRQRDLFAAAKAALLTEAGVYSSEINKDHEAREVIRVKLQAARERNGDDFNPLRELGMIVQDSEGRDVFTFPVEIMPKTTQEKWHAYMRSVKAHIMAGNANRSGRGTQEDLMRADGARKNAHDLLTNDMMILLGMADFEEMRRTIAKMRDGSFPNVATGEEARVNAKLRTGITTAEAMREDLFPQGAWLPEPSNSQTHSVY